MATAETRKEGYLLKKAVRSLLKDNWKKRWIVVDGAHNTLAYFKSDKGKDAILTLPLTAASTVSATSEHKKPFEMKVQTEAFSFFACAASQPEAAEWIRYIQAVIDAQKPIKPPPPPSVKPAVPGAPPRHDTASAGAGAEPSADESSYTATPTHAPAPAPPARSLADVVRKAEGE